MYKNLWEFRVDESQNLGRDFGVNYKETRITFEFAIPTLTCYTLSSSPVIIIFRKLCNADSNPYSAIIIIFFHPFPIHLFRHSPQSSQFQLELPPCCLKDAMSLISSSPRLVTFLPIPNDWKGSPRVT